MKTMNDTTKQQEFTMDADQEKAFALIESTNTSLFITGKAGTGKSTFIKMIQEKIDKNFLVLAPTGIAAINVGGQTMHSFFGFPFEVIGPHTQMKVSEEKQILLRHIDTIIVDEVSMVRCDMVDGMDRFLREAFHTHMPFGGKQVVFVGDLFQLPPVVSEPADEDMLCHLWEKGKPYFYKAHVLKRMNLPKIEFRTVYRQRDGEFLEVLNRLRVAECTQQDLALLNQRVSYSDDTEDYSVILSALEPGAAYRDYDDAFFWLSDAGIVNICYNCTAPNVGLRLNMERNTLKCYMADTGLLISHAFDENGKVPVELYQKLLLNKLEVNQGMIVENVVAQMLATNQHKLYFYSNSSRDDAGERMEIDFLTAKSKLTSRHNITPIEVKSSQRYTLSSLRKCVEKFGEYLTTPVVLHGADLKEENDILFLPLYMAPML